MGNAFGSPGGGGSGGSGGGGGSKFAPKPGQAPPPAPKNPGTLHGVKPEERPGYHVEWPDVHTSNESEKADVVNKRMTAAATYISGNVASIIPEKNFLVDELEYTDEQAEAFISEGQMKQLEDEEKAFQQQKRMLDEGLVADPNNPDLVPDAQFHATPFQPGGGPPGDPGGLGAGPQGPPGGDDDGPDFGELGDEGGLAFPPRRPPSAMPPQPPGRKPFEIRRNAFCPEVIDNALGRKPFYTVRRLYKDVPHQPENHVYHSGKKGLEEVNQIAKIHEERSDSAGVKAFKHSYSGSMGREKVKTTELKRDELGRFTTNAVKNAFCPTGEGGGVDPHCGSGDDPNDFDPGAEHAGDPPALRELKGLYRGALDDGFSHDATERRVAEIAKASGAVALRSMADRWGLVLRKGASKGEVAEAMLRRITERRAFHMRTRINGGEKL
jgi:hypothetical protein